MQSRACRRTHFIQSKEQSLQQPLFTPCQGSFLNKNKIHRVKLEQTKKRRSKNDGTPQFQPRQPDRCCPSAASQQTPRHGGLPKLSRAARRTAAFIPLTKRYAPHYATHWHATSTRKDSISCLPVTVFLASAANRSDHGGGWRGIWLRYFKAGSKHDKMQKTPTKINFAHLKDTCK